MNEWEGDERQDIKIEKYSRADIKRLSSRNTRIKDDVAMKSLTKLVAEQKNVIEKLNEDYKELEKKIIFQADIIQSCKKCVENEWEERKEKLKDKLQEKWGKEFKQILNERMQSNLKSKAKDINRILISIISDKLKTI